MTYLFLDTDNLIRVFEGPEEPEDSISYAHANRNTASGEDCYNDWQKYNDALSEAKKNAIPVRDQEQAKQIIIKAMNWNPHPGEHRIEPGVLYPVGDLKVRIDQQCGKFNFNSTTCGYCIDKTSCDAPRKVAILETTTPEQEKKEESQDDPLEIALEKLDTLYVLDFNKNLITIEELQSATRKVLEEFAASITRKTV